MVFICNIGIRVINCDVNRSIKLISCLWITMSKQEELIYLMLNNCFILLINVYIDWINVNCILCIEKSNWFHLTIAN